jgi:hypothetical protein
MMLKADDFLNKAKRKPIVFAEEFFETVHQKMISERKTLRKETETSVGFFVLEKFQAIS